MQRTISIAPKGIFQALVKTISQDEARARMLRLNEEYRKIQSTGEVKDVREDPEWLRRLFFEAAA